MRRLLLGIDLGSSSVKSCILDASTGKALVSKAFPEVEMPIQSSQSGWAEQDPEMWWKYVKEGIAFVCGQAQVASRGVAFHRHRLPNARASMCGQIPPSSSLFHHLVR